MILIINTCHDPLLDSEFVKPIEDILKGENIKFTVLGYHGITEKDLEKADKVIITGTSLADNEFLEYLDDFAWIRDFKKPILGICAGSHIIGHALGYKLKRKHEIGMKDITLKEDFLGKKKGEKLQVYHLHQYAALPEIFRKDNYYATTFHPEVRNKDLIVNFINL